MNKISATLTLLPAFFIAVILQACNEPQAKEASRTNEGGTPAREVVKLTKGELASSVQIPGELIAFQQVDLYAKVNGFIKKLYADIGDQVSAGQLLATMEAPEYKSQLSGAESRLKSMEAVYEASKATYKRLEETNKTPGTVSPNDLDMALAKQKSDFAQLQAARAAYREAAANNNYLLIRAPFSGVITARNVSAGAYAGPSGRGSEMPVFTLQEQKKLRLAVSVPESYSARVKNGSSVNFTVKGLPGEVFTAKVSRVSGALDSKLRSQRTEMDVTNTDKKLLPGMVAEVNIPLGGSNDAFAIPSEAVLNSTQGVFVIKVVGNKAKWVPVRTGNHADEKTEVFGDLQDGDIIIKTASEEIRDGEDVKL